MDRALTLARMGWPAPNPYVGAVIIREGRIIGTGYHIRRGGMHAEAAALAACNEDPAGAVLVVTMEPCCHSGEGKLTPPCTETIIAAGISTVVVGSLDPNPIVAGKGIVRLRAAGVKVITGIREQECQLLNKTYFYHRRTGLPWVHLKIAQTNDGFASFPEGGGIITGEDVRREVHQLRAKHQAILVGSGTVKTDNPKLNVRYAEGPDPLKIILNTSLDLNVNIPLFYPPGTAWIIGGEGALEKNRREWELKNVPVILVPGNPQGYIRLGSLMEELGRRGIISLMVEGGPKISAALLADNLVQELSIYRSPRNIGKGIPSFSPDHPFLPAQVGLLQVENRRIGSDRLFRYEKTDKAGESCLQG